MSTPRRTRSRKAAPDIKKARSVSSLTSRKEPGRQRANSFPGDVDVKSIRDVRSRLTDEQSDNVSDYTIKAYLAVNGMKTTKAAQAIRNTLQWRQGMQWENVEERSQHPRYFLLQAVRARGSGPASTFGHDKTGRLLFYEKVGQNFNLPFHDEFSVSEWKYLSAIWVETLYQKALQHATENNVPYENVVGVLDWMGCDEKRFWLNRYLILESEKLIATHYPGLIYKCYHINLPPFWDHLWKSLKPLLDISSVNKADIISGDCIPYLFNEIDDEFIPTDLQGSADVYLQPDPMFVSFLGYSSQGGGFLDEKEDIEDENKRAHTVSLNKGVVHTEEFPTVRGTKFKWSFSVEAGKDILFSAQWSKLVQRGRRQVKENTLIVRAEETVTCGHYQLYGDYVAHEEGLFELAWKNPSRVSRKTLRFEVEIENLELAPIVDLEEKSQAEANGSETGSLSADTSTPSSPRTPRSKRSRGVARARSPRSRRNGRNRATDDG